MTPCCTPPLTIPPTCENPAHVTFRRPHFVQGQIPIAPHESRADGTARAEELLDLASKDWRERVTWRRHAVANGRTGAVDLPGTSRRDRPAVDRGAGVYLAGDPVAAPDVLSEVSFNSALTAVSLALGRNTLDLKHA